MDLSKEFTTHQKYLVSYAKKYLKTEEDAQDAVQETFVHAIESLDTFNDNSSVRTWLTSVCRNVCLNKIRKTKRENSAIGSALAEEKEDLATPQEILIAAEGGNSMLSKWKQLPEHTKDALNMKYVQDLSYKQIAEKMNVPLNTVRTWLHRGRAALSHTIRPQ